MEQVQQALESKDTTNFLNSLLVVWSKQSETSHDKTSVMSDLKEFLSKSVSALNTRIAAEHKKVINLTEDEKGEMLCEFPDLQLLEPRGRFKVIISTNSLNLEGKSGGGNIEFHAVKNFIVVQSHTSSKKEGEDLFAMIFNSPIKICGKEMSSVLFNLSKTIPKVKKENPDVSEVDDSTEKVLTESEQFTIAIKQAILTKGKKVEKSDARLFHTVCNAKPFLRCHKGTQEGAIYPLECGILFIKPLLFIPAEKIASLTAGRGGGSGNTRFVDLKVFSLRVYFSLKFIVDFCRLKQAMIKLSSL
jgi:hypothetical protein